MNNVLQQNVNLLGFKVKDRVTGLVGIVTHVGFDLSGCIQAIVSPEVKKGETKRPNGEWFDAKRLDKISKSPVMETPDFVVVPGPEPKPSFRAGS